MTAANEEYAAIREHAITLVQKKIAESVGDDQIITQAIQSIEELNRVCNALSKRLRYWIALTLPELEHRIGDHEKLVMLLTTKDWHALQEETNMGARISEKDMLPILALAQQIKTLYALRTQLTDYVESVMQRHCKNVLALAGALLGAKLISSAGSLKKLSQVHSSTIQLFGAEKALFRHIRNKKIKPPKHGFLLQHPLVARTKEKGKAARALADKLAIAARIDYFKGEFIGDQLRKQLEEKFP